MTRTTEDRLDHARELIIRAVAVLSPIEHDGTDDPRAAVARELTTELQDQIGRIARALDELPDHAPAGPPRDDSDSRIAAYHAAASALSGEDWRRIGRVRAEAEIAGILDSFPVTNSPETKTMQTRTFTEADCAAAMPTERTLYGDAMVAGGAQVWILADGYPVAGMPRPGLYIWRDDDKHAPGPYWERAPESEQETAP